MNSKAEAASDSRDSWFARIQAGLITGLISVVSSISYASLVTGSVAPHATAVLIGMALVGTAVLCFTLGLTSRIKGLIPSVQDVPTAALGAILATVLADRAGQAVGVTLVEIVALCLAAGLAFGLAVYLFGRFRLAAVMRFAPRPVIAGFLAGTGYFVIIGALGICLGTGVSWASLPAFLEASALGKISVAVAVAVAMTIGARFLKPKHLVAVVIGGSLLIFHAVVAILGYDAGQLNDAGWFTIVPADGLPWPPISLNEITALDLSFLAKQIFPLCTMIILATAALLMNLSALEAKTRVDINLDRELRNLGLSNLAAAGLGGLPGFHSVSTTLSGLRIANGHRATSVFAGSFVLLVFFFGNTLLAVLPLPIFAGFILWVGSDLIREWLFREVRVTPPGEAWLTVAIFGVVVAVGLFEGTVFGLAAGALLFIVNYSRLDPIQGVLFGDAVHGSDEMTPTQLKVLEENGGVIAILKLQGYVFFGTAYGLKERITRLVQDHNLRFLIVDFGGVTGVDATAVVSFGRIAQDLENAQIHATLTGMSAQVARVLRRAGLQIGEGAGFGVAPDLNSGLSAYETLLLTEHLPEGPQGPADVQQMLAAIMDSDDFAARLVKYLDPVHVAAGDMVIAEGELASDMYFIENGRLEVLVGKPPETRRVRTVGPGVFIGEISYYSGGKRTTSVRAIAPATLWRFSAITAARVLSEDPELSSRFHAAIATNLAGRVKANTRLIQMLSV